MKDMKRFIFEMLMQMRGGLMSKKKKKEQLEKGSNKNSIKIKRLIAFIVDWYVASVLAGIPVLLIYSIESGEAHIAKSLASMSFTWGMVAGILAIIFASAYYWIIPTYCYKGQTLGKKLVGIKIVSENNNEVSVGNIFKREILGVMLVEGGLICSSDYLRQIVQMNSSNTMYTLLGLVATMITAISIIMLFTNSESKMLHDLIGKTKVVEVARS